MNSTWTDSSVVAIENFPQASNDAALVSEARSGDHTAFDQLTRRHSRRILNRVYRIVGNWQDAEDVLQDSLTNAFLHLNTFEFKASFSTWFTRIAINTALMLLRKRRRYVEIAIDGICDGAASWEGWHLTDKSENPEQYYVRKQSAHMLKAAVMRLKSSSRKILELHQTTGLSVKEIARSLGISESAAKARLNRARGQLRASMKP